MQKHGLLLVSGAREDEEGFERSEQYVPPSHGHRGGENWVRGQGTHRRRTRQ